MIKSCYFKIDNTIKKIQIQCFIMNCVIIVIIIFWLKYFKGPCKYVSLDF